MNEFKKSADNNTGSLIGQTVQVIATTKSGGRMILNRQGGGALLDSGERNARDCKVVNGNTYGRIGDYYFKLNTVASGGNDSEMRCELTFVSEGEYVHHTRNLSARIVPFRLRSKNKGRGKQDSKR